MRRAAACRGRRSRARTRAEAEAVGHVAQADADVEHRRMRPRGHLAPAFDRHPLARNGALLHDERDELASGPSSLIRRSVPPPVKSVSSAHAQPRPAAIASVSGRDFVSVQRVAHLEPKRVARPEAARRRPRARVSRPRAPRCRLPRNRARRLARRCSRFADHRLTPSSRTRPWLVTSSIGKRQGSRTSPTGSARHIGGKGIATAALAQFLTKIETRPVFAHVAKHNFASIRVLQKCGFQLAREDMSPPMMAKNLLWSCAQIVAPRPPINPQRPNHAMERTADRCALSL